MWSSRRFLPVFTTQFLGAFNDNVFKNALVILITYQAYQLGPLSSQTLVAFSGGVFILPYFLFSSWAGQLADKYPKHQMMRWVKILEILIMVVGSIGFFTQNFPLLLLVLFLMGLQSTYFGPIKYSILPELLPEVELVPGNAYFGLGTFLAILLGTILGGVLAAQEHFALLTSATVMGLAVAGTLAALLIPALPAVVPRLKISWNLCRPIARTVKLIRRHPILWHGALGVSWFWFLGASFLSLIPSLAKTHVNGAEDVATFFLALFSLGIAMGSLLFSRLSRGRLELGLILWGSLGIFLCLFLLSFIPATNSLTKIPLVDFFDHTHHLYLSLLLLLFSIFGGMFIIPFQTLLQERSPHAIRSQIIAANNIINALFMVLSALLFMVLFQLEFGFQSLFLILAALHLIYTLLLAWLEPEFLFRFLGLVGKRQDIESQLVNSLHDPQVTILSLDIHNWQHFAHLTLKMERPFRVYHRDAPEQHWMERILLFFRSTRPWREQAQGSSECLRVIIAKGPINTAIPHFKL